MPAGALSFEAGPMHEHLARAQGFVTVSSTAALEAIAQGVPLLVLSDFGVSAEMINLVFEGSGSLGTLDDLAKADFRAPTPEWCAANYFHEAAHNDWASRTDGARAGRPRGHARAVVVAARRPAARRRPAPRPAAHRGASQGPALRLPRQEEDQEAAQVTGPRHGACASVDGDLFRMTSIGNGPLLH